MLRNLGQRDTVGDTEVTTEDRFYHVSYKKYVTSYVFEDINK